MTTAIFFDLDGTLLQYGESFSALFERTLPTAPEGAYEHYLETFFASFADLSTTPYADGFEAVVEKFDLGVDPALLATQYTKHELAATTVSEATATAVERVATQYPTGVLTNGVLDVQRRKLEHHELDQFSQALVVSNDPDVAAQKPDSGIFEAAEDALPADSYVYIGDTYDEDIVGARDAGWDAMYVGEENRDEEVPTDPTVSDVVSRLLD
ncbi:HAD family hydrolase [Haloferax sp. DFSO60]|uniref:HAD family hydrolase n=1 Tax=Haloferax sp. DFSO60 TaxID=3388652 RepID=UPI00397C6AF6